MKRLFDRVLDGASEMMARAARSLEEIEKTIKRADEVGLATIVCSDTVEELFEVGDDSVLRDIDTPEDWAAFRSGRHGTKGIC